MPILASILTALLLWLAFPRYSYDFFAWIALAPLLFVITSGISLRKAFLLGWLAGLIFTFLAESWIAHSMTHYGGFLTIVAYGVALLFAAILAIFPGLFAMLTAWFSTRFGLWTVALTPALWVATEWLRPMITGVTWNALGVSQYEHFSIARLSRFGGVYLISWQIVCASALCVLFAKVRVGGAARVIAAVVIMLVAPFLLPERDSEGVMPVMVAAVQPNISLASAVTPDYFERNLENVLTLSRRAIADAQDRKLDLIVWAESPLALPLESDAAVRGRVEAHARESGCYIIANTISHDGEKYFNSVNIIPPDYKLHRAVPLRRYDKIRLVPFGEYVPMRPLLGRFVPAIVGEFSAGRDAVVNTLRLESKREGIALGDVAEYQIQRETRFVRTGAFICYEAAYPNLVREFVRNGATLLINVSDDAWFGETSGPQQHLAHAVMRAVENDRDIVRATNTGITALVTSEGRVVEQLPGFVEGSKVWNAQTKNSKTYYTQYGDLFALACGLLSVIGIVVRYTSFAEWFQRYRLKAVQRTQR
jgi:apolipoprotein N-acyltransferase